LAGRKSVPINLRGMIARAWRYWRPHPRLAWGLIGLLLIQQAFTTGLAVSLKLIVDNVIAGVNDPPLWMILAGLTVGYVLAAASNTGSDYVGSVAVARITNDIRRRAFEQLQRLGMDYFARAQMGDILARFTSDLGVLRQGLTRRAVEGVLALLGLLINLPILFYLEWQLAIVATVAVPLMVWVVGRLTPGAADATYVMKTQEGAVLNTVQETVRAQPVIKAFGLVEREQARFDVELEKLHGISVKSGFQISLVGTISTLGVQFVQLLITALGAYMAFDGKMTAGDLVAFLTLLGVVSKHTHELTKRVVPSLIKASSGVRRIEELLEEEPSIVDPADAGEVTTLRTAIHFQDVAFSYDGERKHLDRVTLDIEAGQSVAFVGPSGSGKSTILKLVQRFHDASDGLLTWDGTDYRSVRAGDLRGQMGVVFQETFLFDTSIGENIRMGRPEATMDEVEAAARAAEIHELIANLPQGYDTMAGESGGRLSGGQRQRIAIARAMLRDPAVLVLDEATSALDPATEAAINETLVHLAEGRTMISVTHRLSSVVNADCIFVLDGGRVVQSGTHEDLLETPGIYRGMWEKQQGFEVSRDGRRARVDARRLRQIPLFARLDEPLLAALSEQFASERFEKGETVFEAGDAGDRFYVVVRGGVAVLTPEGKQLATLEDGDFFGEMALLNDAPRSATILARTPLLTISLSRAQFNELVEESAEVLASLQATARERTTIP
jgi:ATP-binding cassette subfamily B protein